MTSDINWLKLLSCNSCLSELRWATIHTSFSNRVPFQLPDRNHMGLSPYKPIHCAYVLISESSREHHGRVVWMMSQPRRLWFYVHSGTLKFGSTSDRFGCDACTWYILIKLAVVMGYREGVLYICTPTSFLCRDTQITTAFYYYLSHRPSSRS